MCSLFLLLNLPRPLRACYIGRSNTHTTTFSLLNCIVLGIYLSFWWLLSLQTIWTRFHPVGFVQCLPPIKCKAKYFAHLRPHRVRQNSQRHIGSLHLNKQNEGGRAMRRWPGMWSPLTSSEIAALRNIGSCKRSTSISFLLLHLFDFSPQFSES